MKGKDEISIQFQDEEKVSGRSTISWYVAPGQKEALRAEAKRRNCPSLNSFLLFILGKHIYGRLFETPGNGSSPDLYRRLKTEYLNGDWNTWNQYIDGIFEKGIEGLKETI